jgi:hypothetical protein
MSKQTKFKVDQVVEGRVGRHGRLRVLKIVKLSEDGQYATVVSESRRSSFVNLHRLRRTDKMFVTRPRPKYVKPQVDKPNRRTIEMLFSDLLSERSCEDPLYAAYQRLDTELEELKKRLLNVPAVKRLQRLERAAHDRYSTRREFVRKRTTEVKRLYLAHGLTPTVMRAITQLLKDLKARK